MSSIKPFHLIISMAMALALAGCGDKNSKAVFSPVNGHPSDWTTTHKTFARADLESCVECHGTNLDGGVSKVACTQCHPASLDTTSVHQAAWGSFAYARHAAYVATNGTSTCANASCHGTNLAGNGNIPSCTACHSKKGETYSKHPATWINFSSHATYLKQNSAQSGAGGSGLYPSCSTSRCHGTDLKGVFLSGQSCSLCHSITTQAGAFSKHPVSWSSALASHSSFVVANGNTSCSTSVCHGTDLKGVAGSGPSCSKCHSGGPLFNKHPVNWDGYTKQGVPSHGLYVKTKGITNCATSACHGTDTRGVTGGGPSCFSCHADGPTSEHPVAWTISALRNHGAYTKTNGFTSCATAVCHGTDAKGVTGSGTSCDACHISGPSSMHPVSWTNGALVGHGIDAKTNGFTSCATIYCHGTDAQGGTAGSLAPSCYKCHLAGPTSKHPVEWTVARTEHPSFVSAHITYSCKTSVCHASFPTITTRFNDPAKPECNVCHAN